jgi:murein DD-endopeptidase MepM/ murein hydrolase activator NlpD
MNRGSRTIAFLVAGALGAAPAYATPPKKKTTHSKHHHRRHHRRGKVVAHEQQPIPALPPAPSATATPAAAELKLIIPVAGVKPEELVDTFDAARTGGRVHDAIDIIVLKNTPVLATADGTILRLALNERGGVTIHQLAEDNVTVFYYAHLDHYADGLTEGQKVKAGDTIGFAGDTGNAKPGNFHLHFAIWRVKDLARYWEGDNINPFPLLRH